MPDENTIALDQNILGEQSTLASAQSDLADSQFAAHGAQSNLQAVESSFDPSSATGPQPVFNEPTPQDHFQDVMKQAPLMMALGAIGGALGKQHGITMLASTNAMMKGVVQGNADAYKDAREKYDQQYQDFRDNSKTWLDVYKAYSTAYKGQLDAAQKAVTAANASVGNYEKAVNNSTKMVGNLVQIRKSLEKTDAQIQKMNTDQVAEMIRAEMAKQKVPIEQQNADSRSRSVDSTVKKNDSAIKKNEQKGGEDDAGTQQAVALGTEILKQLESGDTGTFGGAGVGGMASRAKEFVQSKFDKNAPRPAGNLANKADLFTEKMTAALKVKGQRMDAGDRILIREAIDFIHARGISDPQAADKIREAMRVLQKQSGTGNDTNSRTIGGKTYYKWPDGKVYDQPPPGN